MGANFDYPTWGRGKSFLCKEFFFCVVSRRLYDLSAGATLVVKMIKELFWGEIYIKYT
jgi:hypothetical protein